MVEKNVAKVRYSAKNTTKETMRGSATKKASGTRKARMVKRVVQRVPRRKVSIFVLVVLAMASVVTIAWLFDII